MKRSFIPLILAFSVIVAGCKKHKDAKPVCQLSFLIPERGSIYFLSYDDNDRISSMRVGNKETKFDYKGDSIVATERESLHFVHRKTYKMNAQGLPAWMRLDINESGSQWLRYDFEYNGAELAKAVHTMYGTTASYVTDYSWSNGNLVQIKDGPLTMNYEYYTDKPNMQGNAFMIEMILNNGKVEMMALNGGIEIVRNKNLLKKMEHSHEFAGTYSRDYEYGFDREGKIERLVYKSENASFNFQYQCK